MKIVYSEIEGSSVSTAISAPEDVDPSEVFKAMDVSEEQDVARATEAIDITIQFLQCAFPEVVQYSAPRKTLVQKIKSLFSSPDANFSLKWRLEHSAEFNAGIKATGANFVISINYGAIVRVASWCSEIAAIEVDGLEPSRQSTIKEKWHGGALFQVIPKSLNGEERYAQLLRVAILFLFTHEFAHAVGGHCSYSYQNPNMPAASRKALEADADHVGGSAAGAALVHHEQAASGLGWSPYKTPEANSRHLMQTCVIGSLILATLFSELTDSKSERYLRPALRCMMFVGGMQAYIESVARLPNLPEITVLNRYLTSTCTEAARQYGMDLLGRSSLSHAVLEMELQESDTGELGSTLALRNSLKTELEEHRPFGMKGYLEQVQLSLLSKRT